MYVARVTGWNPNSRIPSKKLDDIRGRPLCLCVGRNLVAIARLIMIMNVLANGKKATWLVATRILAKLKVSRNTN